ncbi:MAG: sigma-70 family RNA polymerase sigma factor [Paludibacteraceae bacterium]|nr:sigma-70 family RNA polymerase sigma factor [Paludibacteraceae bacterium]
MKSLKELADRELVKMYELGNDSAFNVLLNRYKDKLYAHIFYMIHDEERADDLFQETFVKAIVCIRDGRYTESGCFWSWLVRIAQNLIIDGWRRERTGSIITGGQDMTWLMNDARYCDQSREDELVNEQVLQDVTRLIDMLPEEQQRVVRMRYYEDLSFKEIAQSENINLNTALGRMRYALINMRRMARQHHISLDMQ